MYPIPAAFAQHMRELYGARGDAWLAQLPQLIAACARRWSLRVLPPFPHLSYNYVAPAERAEGTPVVLKLGVPQPELQSEVETLRWCAGRGAAALLDADAEQGVLLLERLLPGTPLSAVQDDAQATHIAAQVMRAFWRPAPSAHTFVTVAEWARGLERLRARFDGGTGPLPATLVALAERLFAHLLATSEAPVLLHGDLHHANILATQRAPWLAIDPKGVVGEAAFEVGALLRNPLPQLLADPQAGQILARRTAQLADELGFARERIAQWGCAQAVLSAWWSIEDEGTGWEPALRCAELLAAQL